MKKIPSVQHLFLRGWWIFQQDNVGPHSAHATKVWLHRHSCMSLTSALEWEESVIASIDFEQLKSCNIVNIQLGNLQQLVPSVFKRLNSVIKKERCNTVVNITLSQLFLGIRLWTFSSLRVIPSFIYSKCRKTPLSTYFWVILVWYCFLWSELEPWFS